MEIFDYEDYGHLPTDEQRRIKMEDQYGALYVKYKRELGRDVHFRIHGNIFHGIILWVTKCYIINATGPKPRRRQYFPEYVIKSDEQHIYPAVHPSDLISEEE